MSFEVSEVLDQEIVHYADSKQLITSKYNVVKIQRNNEIREITIPEKPWWIVFGLARLSRRALRLDKCNVCPVGDNYVIIRRGRLFHYNFAEKKLTQTLMLGECRNLLTQSICVSKEGYVYFGEYSRNKKRRPVPVYRSIDGGLSWNVIYEFPAGSIKHVHGCFQDPYTGKIWVTTGDFENENILLEASQDFATIRKIGDGQQRFRTCHLIFKEDFVHWIMDSQLEPCFHIAWKRETGEVVQKNGFNGPVWYVKELSDGIYLAATVQEIGEGVLDDKIYLYVSKDLETWEELKTFEHDGLNKRLFKYGLVGFADGDQASDHLYMYFEAVKDLDGKSLAVDITSGNKRN